MTGMFRFCVATVAPTFILAVVAIAFRASTGWAESFSPVTSADDSLASSRVSATHSPTEPPSQTGAYQYVGPFPRSRPEPGLRIAQVSAIQEPLQNALSDEVQFGHTQIQQAQYPLDNESPVTDDTLADEKSQRSSWMPPILAMPGPSTGASDSGWITLDSVRTDATHVVGSGNSLGITTLTAGFAIASPRFEAFSLRPQFGWHSLSGPRSTDLPSQLYDVSVEMRMYWPFGDRWLGEFAIAPGLYTDFENTGADALRIVGRAVGYYRWSPDLQLAIGAAYLDRQDVRALPVAGLVWTPTPDDRVELLIPRPRLAHRFRSDDKHERWVYVAGEFGGGSWAIERTSGSDDIATYRDFRLITGIEFKFTDKSSWRVEGGYVFGRELEYESNLGNYQPRDTTMIRAALQF